MHVEPQATQGAWNPSQAGPPDGWVSAEGHAQPQSPGNNLPARSAERSEPEATGNPGPNWNRALFLPLAILAWGAVILVFFFLAGYISETLLYLAIAGLIAYALIPAVNYLERWIPRWAAVSIVYVVFVGLLILLIYIVVAAVAPQVKALAQQVQNLVQSGQLNQYLSRYGISSGSISSAASAAAGYLQSLATSLPSILTSLFNIALGVIVVVVISIYFLAGGPDIGRWLVRTTPSRHRERTAFVIATISRVIGGYIRGQVTLALLIGVLVGGGLAVMRVPYAVLLGVLAFVLEFIPFIGVFISGAAAVLVALFANGTGIAIIVLAYFVIVHIFEGDVVGPRIVGPAVGVHPAIQLIALIAGAELFGLWGALFAAPVAGIVQAVLVAFWSEYRRANLSQFPELAEAPSNNRRKRRRRQGRGHRNQDHKQDHDHKGLTGLLDRGHHDKRDEGNFPSTKSGVKEDVRSPKERHDQDLDGERGIFFDGQGKDNDGQRNPPQGDGQRNPPQGDGQRNPPQSDGQRNPPQSDGQRNSPQGDGHGSRTARREDAPRT